MINAGAPARHTSWHLSIRSKVLIVLLIVGLGCLAVGGVLGYRAGDTALRDAVAERLTGQLVTKRLRVEAYLANEQRFAAALGSSPLALQAMTAFTSAWASMRQDQTPFDPAPLQAWYRDKFLPVLDHVSGGKLPLAEFLPTDPVAQRLQTKYIVNNSNASGAAPKPTDATSAYDKAHEEFDSQLKRFAEVVRFHDLMLVDTATGDVVYSSAKEPDFASNVFHGSYAQSGLGRVVAKALDPRNGGGTVLEDYSSYAPAGLKPQMFAAYPLASGGRVIGVLVAQLDVTPIDALLSDDGRWAQTGQGQTGETVLVGEDRLFRSQSRMLQQEPDNFFRLVRDNGLPQATIEQIRAVGTSILYLPSSAAAVPEAFRGHSGITRFRDYLGHDVVSAYGPVRVGDIQWAMEVKQDTSEAFGPVAAFSRNLLIAASITSVVLTLLALAWAAYFTRPLRRVLTGMEAMQSGGAMAHVQVTGKDEFAELARGYNNMADAIAGRDAQIATYESDKADTLRALYPQAWAERVRSGTQQTAETLSNVTVTVCWLEGLAPMMAQLDANEMHARLAALFEQLARTAALHDVEPVRSLGESWFGICGLSAPRLDHAARSLAFVEDATAAVQRLGQSWSQPVSLRFGLSSGEINVGIGVRDQTSYDIWGRTMSVARFIAVDSELGEVRVSDATFALLPAVEGFQPCPVINTPAWGPVLSYARAAARKPAQQAAE